MDTGRSWTVDSTSNLVAEYKAVSHLGLTSGGQAYRLATATNDSRDGGTGVSVQFVRVYAT